MSRDYAGLNVSKRDALLAFLSDLEWHDHTGLHRVAGVRYSARVLELKRLGYKIETVDKLEQGRCYRLTSLLPSEPQPKRVKIFLEEEEVRSMVGCGIVPVSAFSSLRTSLKSFQANREKL